MKYSPQNIFSKVKDSENYFIVNPLSGNADLLDPKEAEKLELIRDGSETDPEFMAEMAEKGYITDTSAENKLFRSLIMMRWIIVTKRKYNSFMC